MDNSREFSDETQVAKRAVFHLISMICEQVEETPDENDVPGWCMRGLGRMTKIIYELDESSKTFRARIREREKKMAEPPNA